MNKITKKIIQIKDFRGTRNPENNDDFMLTITSNLLNNLGDRNNFIHKQLELYKSNKLSIDNNLKIATGLYICSLVTCWETFFRDLFIFLCDTDEDIKKQLEQNLKVDIPLDLTIGEFMSRKYNFQNLNQTREAFDYIFKRETIELSDYFTEEVFQGVANKDYAQIFVWIHNGIFKEKVNNALTIGFEIRHKVTHDANFLIDFNSELLSEIENVFQIIPQFFISSFAEKYSQKRLVFNIKEKYIRITDKPTEFEKNYAFNVKDFMAEDYEIV